MRRRRGDVGGVSRARGPAAESAVLGLKRRTAHEPRSYRRCTQAAHGQIAAGGFRRPVPNAGTNAAARRTRGRGTARGAGAARSLIPPSPGRTCEPIPDAPEPQRQRVQQAGLAAAAAADDEEQGARWNLACDVRQDAQPAARCAACSAGAPAAAAALQQRGSLQVERDVAQADANGRVRRGGSLRRGRWGRLHVRARSKRPRGPLTVWCCPCDCCGAAARRPGPASLPGGAGALRRGVCRVVSETRESDTRWGPKTDAVAPRVALPTAAAACQDARPPEACVKAHGLHDRKRASAAPPSQKQPARASSTAAWRGCAPRRRRTRRRSAATRCGACSAPARLHWRG